MSYRSPLAMPLGGAGAAPPDPCFGYRSFLGFWLGGVTAAPATTTVVVLQPSHWWGPMEQADNPGGYLSHLGFWMGGIGA